MRIYNSATHKKEEFQPIESGKVRMYVCGPFSFLLIKRELVLQRTAVIPSPRD